MKRVLLVAATTGYQVREFAEAARALDVELVLATDRCHILENPWGDDAAPVRFEDPEPGIEALAARGPFDGILAVGDRPARVAAQAAEHLGNLRFHPAAAARAASNKLLAREHFRAAGMPVPEFRRLTLAETASAKVKFPCVLKPLDSSGSRGVIRANNQEEFREAASRIGRIQEGDLIVEDYIPGREFALEGVVTAGKLQTLALFDKPDPLEGPYFEEAIYLTPSREPDREPNDVQRRIRDTAQAAVTALGLTDGPVHAEMRLNEHGVWILEVAARPIGGLCARILRFEAPYCRLEQLLLRHALGEDVSSATLALDSHGVMMIPIPHSGVYRGVSGLEDARRVPGVEDIVITAKEGQELLPLPEGSTYLGFLFFRGPSSDIVLDGLREAHRYLSFIFSTPLPVVK